MESTNSTEIITFTQQQLENGYLYLKRHNIEDIFDCFHFTQEQEKNKCIDGLDEFDIITGSYLEVNGKIIYTGENYINHTRALTSFANSMSCYGECCYMYELIKFVHNISSHLCKTMYDAAKEGHLDCINLLYTEDNQSVNERGYDDETPLHVAISRNNIESVKLLIKLGANVNMINPDRETPLHYATRSVEMCKILIENGAKINEKQRSDYTPLYYASNNEGVVEFLISKGAI